MAFDASAYVSVGVWEPEEEDDVVSKLPPASSKSTKKSESGIQKIIIFKPHLLHCFYVCSNKKVDVANSVFEKLL